MLRELLTSDIQGVKSIRSVGAVFEKILFRLGVLLVVFVLAETKTATIHLRCLNSEDQIIVVLAVEERHEPLLPYEYLVDEQVLLIMLHRIAEIQLMIQP